MSLVKKGHLPTLRLSGVFHLTKRGSGAGFCFFECEAEPLSVFYFFECDVEPFYFENFSK